MNNLAWIPRALAALALTLCAQPLWAKEKLRYMEALDRGQYGECIRCDDDINEKRLEVVPWATMCVRCQEEAETEASSQSAMAGLEGDGPEL